MNETELFRIIHQIADFIHSFQKEDLWFEDLRNEEPNPFKRQTQQGLFLELYYSLPNALWTPWGVWNFGGSGTGNWDLVNSQILKKLAAAEYLPLKVNRMDEFSPVYSLHQYGDVFLPDPIERKREEYIPYEAAIETWKILKKSII